VEASCILVSPHGFAKCVQGNHTERSRPDQDFQVTLCINWSFLRPLRSTAGLPKFTPIFVPEITDSPKGSSVPTWIPDGLQSPDAPLARHSGRGEREASAMWTAIGPATRDAHDTA